MRVAAGGAVVGAVAWKAGAAPFARGVRAVDGTAVAAALLVGLATTVASAGRWCLVARRLGLRLPLAAATAGYYRALFLNAVLPAGVLGDVHRAVDHGRRSGDVRRGLRAVLLERAAGQAVLLVAAAALLITRPVTLLVLTACAAALPSRRVRGALGRAAADLRGARAAVAALSAAVLAGHVAMFVLSARLAGASAPVTALLPVAVLALLAMAVPANIGGWGPREAVTASAFGAAGMGAAQGLTAAVVYGVLALVASLPGLLVLLPGVSAACARTAPRRPTAPRPSSPVRPPRVSAPHSG
ncbi:flippase-like domain-containing protein [Actinomadura sp. PM05-2]|uniref:Flippase-like domain-containing protein n=1 Tax=Actinomadura parmotrematis TaxID=2864039 RepID=A0ABS7FLT6_9ACTN|nr:flippase-like domain-containing protein [Actinomadura parmotrematis]